MAESLDASLGTLYLVSTPIGNYDDWSERAKTIVCQVDVVAAEDTRKFGLLAAHHGLSTQKTTSYFKGNENRKTDSLLEWLKEGQSIALVSDAGTPLISDPGEELVRRARDLGVDVKVIPGPSALTAALAGCGLPVNNVFFKGFLPRQKSARRKELLKLKHLEATLVFYESPRRLLSMLVDLKECLHPKRQAVVVRELTKTYEEYIPGTLAELVGIFEARDAKGETVVVVEPRTHLEDKEVDLESEILELSQKGYSPKDITNKLVLSTGKPKRHIYQLTLSLLRHNLMRVNKGDPKSD